LERTKKEYNSDIPFEMLYIEGDFYGNYILVKTPKNPFFIRFNMDGGSFCADKIHMRVINPYEMPYKDEKETKFFEKNIYINGTDAMYDDSIYYEFFKLVTNDNSLGDQFYLDYPNIHYAEYLFELSEKQRQELKDTINTVHNYSLVIASQKYDYSYENMRAYFLNEDGGGHMNLQINGVTRFRDGGTTIIKLTAFCDGGTKDFELFAPTQWDKEKMPTLNSFEIKKIEDEKRKNVAIRYLGLQTHAEYLS
jgi:hypothetical protein